MSEGGNTNLNLHSSLEVPRKFNLNVNPTLRVNIVIIVYLKAYHLANSLHNRL